MLKTVLLLGDSIRMQYQSRVSELLLEDDIIVYGPHDNCRFSKHTLWAMWYWVNDDFRIKHFDMIHCNCGTWDIQRATADNEIFAPVEEYAANCGRIQKQAEQFADKFAWATIIPGGSALRDDTPMLASQPIWNADVDRYNAAALEVFERQGGVLIDDLHACIGADTEKYICADGLHLSEEGIEAAAQQVAAFIRENI